MHSGDGKEQQHGTVTTGVKFVSRAQLLAVVRTPAPHSYYDKSLEFSAVRASSCAQFVLSEPDDHGGFRRGKSALRRFRYIPEVLYGCQARGCYQTSSVS